MKLKTFIAQFFRDDSGMSSATRLAFIVWSLGVFLIWVYMCVLTKTLVVIPQTVVELTLVFMMGKVSGAWVENMGSNSPISQSLLVQSNTPPSAPIPNPSPISPTSSPLMSEFPITPPFQ